MPQFSANISTLFTDRPLVQRFQAAADQGFKAVEMQFPYEIPAEELAAAADAAGVKVVLINAPAGDWSAGERGFFAIPGREGEVEPAMNLALAYARALDCPRIHVLAGIVGEAVDPETAAGTYLGNLEHALVMVEAEGRTLMIEPINLRDVPDYFLTYLDEGLGIIESIGRDNLRLQMDFYHSQIMDGDLIRSLETALPVIGHMQIAGVPTRQEPDLGEINYPAIFEVIDRSAYEGWVGCEYFPAGKTEDGLGWAAPYGIGPKAGKG